MMICMTENGREVGSQDMRAVVSYCLHIEFCWMAKNTAGSLDADSTPMVSRDNVSLGELEPCGKHMCKQLQPVKSCARDRGKPVSV